MKWKHVVTAVLVTIVLLPAYLLRAKVFGVPTTVLEIMILTTLILAILAFVSSKINPESLKSFVPSKWLFPLTILLLAATISLFTTPDKLAALGVYRAYLLEPIAFAILLLFLLKQNHLAPKHLYTALGLSALFVAIVAIAQWFIPSTIPIPWDFERRVTSIFEYPNSVGLYLAPIVTIAWISVITFISTRASLRTNKFFLWSSVAILGSIAILLAQSEAAIVAVLASVVLYTLIQKKTRKISAILGALAILVVTLSPWRSFVIEKLTLQDYSGQVRLNQWSETWQMLKDRPITGAGLSGYPEALKPYHQATHYEIFQYPHNIFLNTWSELGILGLIGLLVLLVTIATTRGVATQLPTFALLTIFIHGLVDVPYFKNDLAVLTCIFLVLFIYATSKPSKT